MNLEKENVIKLLIALENDNLSRLIRIFIIKSALNSNSLIPFRHHLGPLNLEKKTLYPTCTKVLTEVECYGLESGL